MVFNVQTTIILGAGASAGYGFPTGDKLIDEIISQLENDVFVSRESNQLHVNKLLKHLKHFDPRSIDAFLAHYNEDKEFVDYAKKHIAHSILSCCNKDVFVRGYRHKDEFAHWYRFLWDDLVAGQTAKQLCDENNNLNFNVITFNYDSSLEYFLASRVAESTFLNDKQKEIFIGKLKNRIHHVYGALLDDEWNEGRTRIPLYKFGGNLGGYADFLGNKIFLINERE